MGRTSLLAALVAVLLVGANPNANAQPATGPLTVSVDNPRYFQDPSGQAVLLTGSHVWYNLVDMGPQDPPDPFDFPAYLAWLQGLEHNFIRMWRWELTTWDTLNVAPHPWARTGPGTALDGKLQFDLDQFNQSYFDRLRSRVQTAGGQGFYVSVMLFEGWGVQFASNAWDAHPFNPANNINPATGVMAAETNGLNVHTLTYPAITAIQEAYVRKVVDTVNDLDNVLYEIGNEVFPGSTAWQYHMIDYVRNYELTKPKQHPIGMTFQYSGGSNQTLFDSSADWISPNFEGGYRDDPPAGNGAKVILNDTDHLWGIGGSQAWVWESFTRGLNPIFMDPYDGVVMGTPFDPTWDPVRQSMGYALSYAKRMNLNNMTPNNALASSTYCLAEPGSEYFIYAGGGLVTVDLSAASGPVSVEWFNPNTGVTEMAAPVSGGSAQFLISPFGFSDAVLYLKATEPAALGAGPPFFKTSLADSERLSPPRLEPGSGENIGYVHCADK